MQILSTDHGTHPMDKWAVATANQVVQTKPGAEGKRVIAALKLRAAVAEILMDHHQAVNDAEKSGLAANGGEHLQTPFDASNHTPDALEAVIDAARGTVLEDLFVLNPAFQAEVASVLTNHFNTHAHVERQHYADQHPNCPISQAFLAQHHYETVVPADDEPAV